MLQVDQKLKELVNVLNQSKYDWMKCDKEVSEIDELLQNAQAQVVLVIQAAVSYHMGFQFKIVLTTR